MIKPQIAEQFIGRVVTVVFSENSVEDFTVGKLLLIAENCLILENLKGLRSAIDLNRVVKIKEKEMVY